MSYDIHEHSEAFTELGATRRAAANLRTVLEATAAFRKVRPDDPVRYDFALTRPGILGLRLFPFSSIFGGVSATCQVGRCTLSE